MATPPTYLTEYLDDFRGGVDTNTPSRSLLLSTLSLGLNVSLRGRFAKPRPPVRFINIIDPNGLLPALSGIFQGSGYYKPDSGPESLFLSVSGRLFQLTPDNLGNATLQERTIPGDLNSVTTLQVWMWQAENFLIVNDGVSLPIFFDGTTSRRSLGSSNEITLATIGVNFTAPTISQDVVVNTEAPYTGPIGQPVVVGGDDYTVAAVGTTGGSAFTATLLQTSTFTANPEPSSQVAFMKPSAFYAFPVATETFVNWTKYTQTWPPAQSQLPIPAGFLTTVKFSRPFTGALYTTLYLNVSIQGVNVVLLKCGVAAISTDGLTLQLVNFTNFNQGTRETGLAIQGATSITWTSVMAAASPYTLPGTGGSMTVAVTTNYTGAVGDYLYVSIPNVGTIEFQLTAFTASGATYTLTLTNVNATAGKNYVAPLPVSSTSVELPAGRMGTYGQGRVWMALTDGASFIGSDLVGSSSGSSQYQFRDAVLKVTQNVTLAGGVNFRIPSSGDTIRAMVFPAQLDASLGQGPLAVFTDFSVYSCTAPTDATTWANLTTPILPSALSGAGGKSQGAVVLSNADIIFRSNTTNIRSLLLARLDFNQWGDTPVSTELIRFLQFDNQTLLTFASGIEFDNRVLMTCNPLATGQGVYHLGLVALNFDEITTLAEKSQSIWEGLWTGLNVFSLQKGAFALIDRAFAFVFDVQCAAIQLYELLPELNPAIYDVSDFGNSPITFAMESSDLFRGQQDADLRVFKALEDGELAVDQVLGPVTFQVFYRNDQSPQWTPWRTFSVHVDENAVNANAGYFPRLGLGKPDELQTNDGFGTTNTRFGHTFQVRLVTSGNCRILGGRFRASVQPEPEFKTPIDNSDPVPLLSDSLPPLNDFTLYNLNNDLHPCGGPPGPIIPPQPQVPCVTPGSLPTFQLPGTAAMAGLMGRYTPSGTLWVPDDANSFIYVVSTPNPNLVRIIDISAFVTGATATPTQVIYDSVNDQMVAITHSADIVFINPHSYHVTGNLLNIVETSSGHGSPWMSYDSKRGNVLVHYSLDTFESGPMNLVLVSGQSRSIILTSSIPPLGPVGSALGNSFYVPITDTFYFGNVNYPQIQTFHPVTGAIGFGPLSVGTGFYVQFARFIPELGLAFIGVADTTSSRTNIVESWNPDTNAVSGPLTGADVTNPWNVVDLAYNPCTNTLYTSDAIQILKFNATTLAESAKVVAAGAVGMYYIFPQNVVWFMGEPGGLPKLETTS